MVVTLYYYAISPFEADKAHIHVPHRVTRLALKNRRFCLGARRGQLRQPLRTKTCLGGYLTQIESMKHFGFLSFINLGGFLCICVSGSSNDSTVSSRRFSSFPFGASSSLD